ncbi:MAG: hypothetical protein EBU96_06840 [Actinobacteria bacterium]|nr:hypothetical protein [Actinomycetota bacterium]
MAVYEQPGRTITVDKDGKQTLTVVYIGDQEASAPSGASGTRKSKTVTTDVAGQVKTTFQYDLDASSTGGSTAATQVQVEIVSSVRTVPIETHPNFSEQYLSAADKKKIKDAVSVPDRSPTFEDTGNKARAISLYGYLINGVESYYVPSLIVRKTYQASSPPSAGKVGKITSPGVSIAGVPKGATFLLINISSRGQTGAYSVTEEYEMSGEGGWDTFLYG